MSDRRLDGLTIKSWLSGPFPSKLLPWQRRQFFPYTACPSLGFPRAVCPPAQEIPDRTKYTAMITLRTFIMSTSPWLVAWTFNHLFSTDNKDGSIGPMHDRLRHPAEQESLEPLPSMGADHNQVVIICHVAHRCDGITQADIMRHCEVRAGQRLGSLVHDLLSMPLTLLRPAFEPYYQMWVDQMQRGDDREDGNRDGVLEGMRRQPSVQTDRVLAIFHCHEDASDGASFSFHDQGRHRGME